MVANIPENGLLDSSPSYVVVGTPLFPLRGLPGDVTKIVLDDYLLHKTYIHNPTWIITGEFLECKEMAYRLFREEYQLEWLKPYDLLYSFMNDHEKAGELCRLIFWVNRG